MKNEAMAVIKTQVSIYTLAIIVFAACIYFFEKCVRKKFQKQKCYRLAFGIYCVAVLWITLLSRGSQTERIAFLQPLRSYFSAYQAYLDNVRAATQGGIISTLERIRCFLYGYNWLILNVLLFIPYGILATMAFPKKRKALFFYGILGSATIELMQYIFKLGCLDADDLIQNVMGIGIGYLVACSLKLSQVGKNNELHQDDG